VRLLRFLVVLSVVSTLTNAQHGGMRGRGGVLGYPSRGYPYAYEAPAYPYAYDYGNSRARVSPPIVIENYSAEAPRSETNPSYGQADYHLIAFNDDTIRAAVSFWLEGDEIHSISPEHEQKRAPLLCVDRQFSEQINRERHDEMKLP
jgi:hypothetical protein